MTINSEFVVCGPQTSKPSLSRPVMIVGLIALLVLGSASLWFVFRAAWADAITLSARSIVAEWREGSGPAFTPELWDRTRGQLQSALNAVPGNARLHDDLGFLHAARSQGMGDVPIDGPEHLLQQTLMEAAIDHYREASALRPTFPYSLTYLALAKHLREQHDEEFWSAFDHAMQYGQTEAALQSPLAEIGFANWSRLGVKRQKAVVDMVANAKAPLRKKLTAMADQAGIVLRR
ncbi:MAG: hypothetical protein WAT63_11585 [Rhodoferax sp.]